MNFKTQAPAITGLNRYIERNLEHFKRAAGEIRDDRKLEWEPLERKFRELLREKLR